MDMTVLQVIQSWHTPLLDKIMVTLFHTIIDEKGVFAVILGLLLLIIPKTRKCGGLMLLSVLFTYLLGGPLLKNIICRPRPFLKDTSVTLITEPPHGYSFPSLHTANAFACAVTVFLRNKKAGIPCLIFAALIGFSRLYFFVHYPSDVICGIALGSLTAFIVAKSARVIVGHIEARKDK